MMEEAKVSVVIPIYNVERFLDRCVSSVSGQSYKNIEIILVDDGSPDLCPEMCDEWAKKDDRVVVIHKENGGLSDARNAGIDASTGEMICFVDSDDWIEKDTVMLAANEMEKTKAQVVVWGFSSDSVDFDEKVLNSDKVSVSAFCRSGEGYETILKTGGLSLFAWNKLYKTDFLKANGFKFEKNLSLIEDAVFNSMVLPSANAVSFISFIGTHYIQRKRNTLGNKYYADCFDLLTRSANSVEGLLGAFGAPQKVKEEWKKKKQFRNLQQVCRNICNANNLNFSQKKKALKKLLKDKGSREILIESKPLIDGFGNRVYRLLMKKPFLILLLGIEKIRIING